MTKFISALTVAGSDSGGGAGIQQDLKVFSAFRVHGASVITALTAQNTQGVDSIHTIPVESICRQFDSVMCDLEVRAVKTGMLANSEIIGGVRDKISEYGIRNLVVDPVMVATSGDRLLDDEAIGELKELLKVSRLSTPNIAEAEILSGREISDVGDMRKAAGIIGDCVVKGGHLNAIDVLCWGGRFYEFPSKVKVKARLHGTGCAFSAAIAACLARDDDVLAAVGKAKRFMDESISRNLTVGGGSRIIDVSGLKLGETVEDVEKKKIIGDIEKAVNRFISYIDSYRLVPEVGVNIAMALPDARGAGDVAGVTGRLVRDRRRVVSVGDIKFGGSSHVARIILTVMGFDPDKRAALNIRFSADILEAAKNSGFSMSSFNREEEPGDARTMEWGTSEAIKAFGGVPDVIYDRGGVGKEAMIRVLGNSAIEVVDKAIKIGKTL